MFAFSGEDFIPIMIFAIPIVAIVGGITAGIVRTLGRQRLIEIAARERIAAIERGVDPAKLPPVEGLAGDGDWAGRGPLQRAQGLLVGGIVTTFTGIGVTLFFRYLGASEGEPWMWAIGLIPTLIGIGLLLSAALVWPRGGSAIR